MVIQDEIREIKNRNTQKENAILAKSDLSFLILCPVILMAGAAGILPYTNVQLGEICALIAVLAIVPSLICGRIYDERISRTIILISAESIICLVGLNPIIKVSMFYLLVPLVSILYLDKKLFVSTARNCFFCLLAVEIIRFVEFYNSNTQLSFTEVIREGYEGSLPNIIGYVLIMVCLFMILDWINALVGSASHMEDKKESGEKAHVYAYKEEEEETDLVYNVKGLFLSVNQTMQGLIRGKEKSLVVNVDYDLPAQLKGDPERIKLALVSLLSDFLQYTEEGTVTLSVTYEKGITPRKGQNITLICRILCSEDLTQTLKEGVTMGVALAKNLIQKMDGVILDKTFGSAVRQTCYTVSILQKVAEEETLAAVKQKNRDDQEALILVSRQKELNMLAGRQVKALVVDDSKENRRLISAILKGFGIHATTAATGQEAIDKISSKAFDFVIIDHMMPGKSGIQTAKEIRQMEDPYFELVPLMVMSSNVTDEFRHIFEESGFSEIISKPIKEEELRLAISRIYLS